MNRKRLILIGAVAVVLAAVVSAALYRILRRAVSGAQVKSTEVVAAAVDLPVGTTIEEADLILVKMPEGTLPDGLFRSTSAVTGRGVVLPIVKNQVVLATSLAAPNGGAGLPSLIPEGMRAVSVKVNDVVSVAGFTVPGTRVDVLLTGTLSRTNDPAEYSTTTILENIAVLTAGPSFERTKDGKAQTGVTVVTLLLTPEEAQKLTLAMNEGKIQLTLRNPLDLKRPAPPLLKTAALYGGAPPKVTGRAKPRSNEKPAPAPIIVELIQGDKRQIATF